MKNLLIFLILISNGAFAAVSGSGLLSSVANQGNKYDSDTPAKIIPGGSLNKSISLIAGKASATNGNYYRTILMGSGTNGANYQVTNGKVLYCSGIWAYASATTGVGLGYGTAAVTDDNSTPPTGQVNFGNATTRTLALGPSNAQGNYRFFPFPMSFPSQSFPYIKAFDSNEFAVIFVCEEQ